MIYSDTELARLLCNNDKNAISTYQKENKDKLMMAACKNLNKSGYGQETFKPYITNNGKGESLRVNADSSKAYLWLLDELKRRSCKYKGLEPLKDYLESYMFKYQTKVSWIRYHKGSVQYIPPEIKDKGILFEKVTEQKLKDKFKTEIVNKLNILPVEYDFIISDEKVIDFLDKRGKLREDRKIKTGDYHRPEQESTSVINKAGQEVILDPSQMKPLNVDKYSNSPEYDFLLNEQKEEIAQLIKKLFNPKEIGILKVVLNSIVTIEQLKQFAEKGDINIFDIQDEKDYNSFYDSRLNIFVEEFRKCFPLLHDDGSIVKDKKGNPSKLDKKTIRYYFDEYFG
jgi:hypothetical protein